MNELTPKESLETKNSELNGYKEIKPENGTTYPESKSFWKEQFSEETTKTYYVDNGEKYREGNSLEPNIEFEKNGYTYNTDDMGRVVSAEGKLQVKDHQGRREMPDRRDVVARGEMASSDDSGHLIADRFNGSGELENLVPMESNLNRGDYVKMESMLADAVKDGADVRLKVEPVYEGESYRPSEFKVTYSIDGEKDVIVFKNGSENGL